MRWEKLYKFVLMNIRRVKRYSLLLQLLTLFIFSSAASAQSPKEIKEIFAQAESYYLYEEYELANQLYLLLDIPENLNIKYKIGTCYLNISDEKEKAIPYLEASVKNASYNAKSGSVKEKRAPLDAYFLLAKAYMINNDFEKSLSTYQKFNSLAKEAGGKGGMENLEFVNQQIKACNNAAKLKDNPKPLSRKILGKDFSMGSMNENPAVSFDGNTIVYTERRGLVNVILFSKKIRGRWQTPVEITTDLNAGDDCSSCALNKDGTELFLYKTDNFDGNIYSSNFVDDSWTAVVRLNRNINTKFYESHASVSADGKRLYFTSNRESGLGGLDIYVSEKDNTGDWGPAVNMGSEINTDYNEDNPFITENDSVLYFCSEGHNSIGGYDNFRSRIKGSSWTEPENLGHPVNSTDDDKFFQPANNGMNAYYSMRTDYKKKEIFFLGLEGPDVNQIYEIAGIISLNDTAFATNKNYSIHILNKTSGDTLYFGSPERPTGKYNINVAPGKFSLVYTGDGYLTQKIDTEIVQDNPELIVNLNVTLIRDSSLIVPVVYDKINLAGIPVVASIDSSILIKNMNVLDAGEPGADDSNVLYYTIQVMALRNPVDVSYFKRISDMRVMYNDADKFYRYTTGNCATREEAAALRLELIKKGYPDQIFIKKVLK